MISFEMPWPVAPLWPNRKAHWSKRAPAVRDQRAEAHARVIAALGSSASLPRKGIHLWYTFCAPTERRFDLDNALNACKGCTDGIADALDANDFHFTFQIQRGTPVRAGGLVKISVTWEA